MASRSLACRYSLCAGAIAESFDDDPFEILAWRGRGREELLENLRSLRGTKSPTDDTGEHDAPPVPLAEQLGSFYCWQGEFAQPGQAPTRADAILDELPALEATVRGESITDLLRSAHR